MWKTITRLALLAAGFLAFSFHSLAATPPAEASARLKAGQTVDLIVEYDDATIVAAVATLRRGSKRDQDEPAVVAYKTQQYKFLKQRIDGAVARPGVAALKDYSHLPMAFKRFKSEADLNAFLASPGVKAVYPNRQFYRVLAQSLPLIGQPTVAAASGLGSGATVAVIDDGIDYTKAAFGSCTYPGVPINCGVVVSQNFGSGATDTRHGSNVSAIVLGVAPAARIAMLNAFSGTSAYLADILSAINWAIANRTAYNIVAINMSLGDGTKYTSACTTNNPFLTPFNNARNAGLQVVVAAGNEAFIDGLPSPACTPGVISVGAIYDANYGGLNWGLCTDTTSAANKITCFSNSASFLTMLAPGAVITAADIAQGGTSQAAPHVAGAIAILRSTFPNETLEQIQTRMTSSGVSITDTRNGITKPRLNLLEAARPGNDAFANRATLSGSAGTSSGVTQLSSHEVGEPDHAGNASGGHSVWWRWTAPASGQFSLDTHGSGFDTLLAVYTGTSVTALTPVASNDNNGASDGASGLLFQAVAGKEYAITIDGVASSVGTAIVNWALNTTANANLSATISGPGGAIQGITSSYTLTITNAGPQVATNVWVTATLPFGAAYSSGPAGCAVNGNLITCFVGTMANTATTAWPITITWSAIAEPVSISVDVSSDLPDAVTSNNSVALQVDVESGDTDAPTLPQWGLLLLGTLLLGSASVKKARI